VCSKSACHRGIFWGSEAATKAAAKTARLPENQRGRLKLPQISGRSRTHRRRVCTSARCRPPVLTGSEADEARDDRPLEEVHLAFDSPPADRDAGAAKVRKLRMRCGVSTVGGIWKIGCTAVMHFGLTIDDGKFIRSGLAGSGVGLTCVVPQDRFCLIHEVQGQWEIGDDVPYSTHLKEISRPLPPKKRELVGMERGHATARRKRKL
jgi:hypothetical protein